MKAVIPVAGAGTNLRPLTYTQPKPLIPVAGKTIISFIIDQLVDAGVKDFVFIIGYLGEKIKNFVEENYPKLHMEFVYQKERFGLGHAIWSAKDILKNEDRIFIVLGDTIFDVDFKAMMDTETSCLGTQKVEDPRDFGVVEKDEYGVVSKVIEKPKIPKSNLAMVGLYKIDKVNLLLDSIEYNIKNDIRTYGEFQLTDGLQRMIEQGAKFVTFPVNNWFDCGKKEILLETNAMLLDKKTYGSSSLPNFEGTIIIHPVSIGEGCQIKNSIIGPHVSIGSHTSIDYSIIKESIIGSYASIAEIVLKNSVVGSDAAIKGWSQSLNIGDNTEIDFS
ncbi:MAG TPA: glucose-1-phosphate thymidylyltransferase [Phaeodactylibacter sp.]|nr:glucose-1-phosphate thymidylyltransferase [Phaeodactylibacter sp.]